VARLGGDEFAILLPEIDQESAPVVVSKIHQELAAEMRKLGWTTTSSVGAVTYIAVPSTTDEVVRMADEIMYEVKRGGKNAVKCSVYAD
jgi:diguanylate cyclase (GGDEF)-like protein